MLDFKEKIKDKLSSAESDGMNLNNYEEKLREFAKTRQEYAELVAVRGLSSSQPLLELMEILGSGADIKKSLGKDTGKIDVLSKQVEKDNHAVNRFIEELRIENDKRKKELSEASKRITTLEKEIQQTDNLEERLKEFLERKVQVAGIEPQLIQNWEEKRQREKQGKRKKRIIAIAVAAGVVCITFAVLFPTVIIPNNKYNAAVALMNNGQYEEAITAFEAMDGYKDSKEKIAEIGLSLLDGADVGSKVYLGMYEQDNNTENGKEKIEWTVLAKEGDRLLLISNYALEARPYNTESTDVTWESCTLRTWLNTEFYTSAFGAEEQKLIAETTVTADMNPEYGIGPGNPTKDKVFLLSIPEANQYFANDEARKCVPTAYAKAEGACTRNNDKTASGEATCWWWLRSPGDSAVRVIYDGSVSENGNYVDVGDICVRPALWIDLKS